MAQSEFFFQQRRGQLKLRSFASLDLERVVRDVDVDLLQSRLEDLTFANLREEDVKYMTDPLLCKLFRTAQLMIEYLLFTQSKLAGNLHNLAGRYSQQKESLLKKRHQLAELKALVAHLEGETAAKKQGMQVLETLLLDGSKARRGAADTAGSVQSAAAASNTAEAEALEREVLSFCVVDGRAGLCVEFTECRDTPVSRVVEAVRDMLQSSSASASAAADGADSNEDEGYYCTPPKVQLVHRGVVLSPGSSLGAAGLREGDTVVAIVAAAAEPASASAAATAAAQKKKRQQQQPEERETDVMRGVLAEQERAMRGLTDEIRRSFESALDNMQRQQEQNQNSGVVAFNGDNNGKGGSGNNDVLLTRIDERYSRFEAGMRQQLDAQLQQYVPPPANLSLSLCLSLALALPTLLTANLLLFLLCTLTNRPPSSTATPTTPSTNDTHNPVRRP